MMVYTQESQVEDGKFKCKSCCALFTSVWGLRTHQRMSEGCLDKNAPRIPRIYSKNKIILSDAAAKSIANGENICPNCAAKFSTSWGLRTHLRTSSLCSENETDVKGCDSRKNEDVTITKNGRVQPGAGCYLCPQCPKTFKLPFSLEQHFVEHAPQKDDWRCHLCTNDFADQFTMHRHFHREHLGKWFCIMCEKKCVLNSFTDFYAHIFDQHASDPGNSKKYFKCPICFKSFISKFSYDFHVASCKKLAEQVFTCASCQKVFNKKIHITNHMKYAHTEL
uniref:C2H2-type domain-containing protein n=2 Tax=Lygus hesperus TaxID=30085 RepID=A0A0K8TEN4_LYGHE